MKKAIAAVTALLILLTMIPLSASAARTGPIEVYIDGKFQPYDQPPVQKDGYTFVPLRGIFESLGAKLELNGNTIRAVKGNTVIEHTIGEKTAIINGQSTTLAMPSLVINGRTLVPLRFVSEALGAQVEWSSFHRIVYVGTTDRNKLPL
ncbi:copper amine oxidase N-terminal domain-containing protein [Paenibacillus sediminis]|uniref:Copper amine oxidase-like N-terminal domain-containing protein n=1 Tax=Paenibacillus sediminis TaxID=664909 RepID=A0ABS4H6V7_9BACL|nr:copper amine oxidase N-terminal domain-containing protein [Paenibacillus sediminis]MBP1938097.1 hypothetical protein [Paenibacillus sediminis]